MHIDPMQPNNSVLSTASAIMNIRETSQGLLDAMKALSTVTCFTVHLPLNLAPETRRNLAALPKICECNRLLRDTRRADLASLYQGRGGRALHGPESSAKRNLGYILTTGSTITWQTESADPPPYHAEPMHRGMYRASSQQHIYSPMQ
jgi:hypothetical protein